MGLLAKQGTCCSKEVNLFSEPHVMPLSKACIHSCPLKNAALLSIGGF